MNTYEKTEKAYDILTNWLVDRSDNGKDHEDWIPFEDIDPEIDEARGLLGDALEDMATSKDALKLLVEAVKNYLHNNRSGRSRENYIALATALEVASAQTGQSE